MKHIDPAVHKRVTGKSNQKILHNLELVSKSGVPVIVRIPVIPGINDSEDNIKDMARYIAGLDNIKEVNLLPYHRLGVSKYIMLDRKYSLSKLMPLEHSELEKYLPIFDSFNITCKIEI
jgi:pyruvate formate lyase activating enzyme